ncbi:ABC transporter substrate-binding protein [Egibacter rhizosphaerae]|uniref:ABC transporter substrate-binding protein n=1 Tax=Egibacter rhizosphaerae TaxID=1670831 RepID=UPI00197A92A4|nr:ABC transporter substrate-binding protein [Egibacter rhizosphaerae]
MVVLALLVWGCDDAALESDAPDPPDEATDAGTGTGEAGSEAGGGTADDDPTESQEDTAGAPGDPSADLPEGVLFAAIGDAPDTLDPHEATGLTRLAVLENVYDRLVEPNGVDGVEPALAERWEPVDGGQRWVFELREGVRWHDGAELDGHDVRYSIERAKSAQQPDRLGDVSSVEVPDEHTVEVVLEEPRANLPADLGRGRGVAIVPEGSGEVLRDDPVGTGPFAVADATGATELELEAFSDHWGGAPELDGITYRTVRDDTARMDALAAGEVDWAHRVTAEVRARDADGEPEWDDVIIGTRPRPATVAYALNHDRQPWAEAPVREALAAAVRRGTIAEAARRGAAQPGRTALPPGTRYHIPGPPGLGAGGATADPLGAAGLEEDALEGLELDLLVPDDDEARRVGSALAAQWRGIGLDARTRVAAPERYESALRDGAFDATLVRLEDHRDPADTYEAPLHSEGAHNVHGFVDEEVDAILEEARQILDPQERAEAYERAVDRIREQHALTYLYHPLEIQGWRADVTGYEIRGEGSVRFEDVSVER